MRGRNWELQPLYQLQLLLCEKGLLWRTDVASPAAPSAQGSILSPLKGERDSLPGASGRNASADFFGRKHQGHKSKTQISSDCLMCSQKSESVAWLTVPLCPVLAALQRVWPAHCAHAHCLGEHLQVWAAPPAWRHSERWLMSLAALTLCIAPLSPGSSSNGLLNSYGHKVAT